MAGSIIFAAWAVVLAGASSAIAQEPPRQAYAAKLTSQTPSSSTGLEQTIEYVNPSDPDVKPYAVSQVVFTLPEGSVVDTSVPPQCSASEAEFLIRGADACPPATRVGNGALTADTGAALGVFPRLIETDVTFFNNEDQLILFAESTNTPGPPIRVASRVQVREQREFVSNVPPLPGVPPPDPFLALRDVVNRLDPLTAAGRHYITTPPSCPPSGSWAITATFTYRDGVVQSAESQTPCKAQLATRDKKRPRLRVRGVPVRGCTTTDFRVRVRIADSQSGPRRTHLLLDGRRLTATRKNRLSRRIRASKLQAGRHRLKVVAIDNAGNRAARSKRFRVCAKRRRAPSTACPSRSSASGLFRAPTARAAC